MNSCTKLVKVGVFFVFGGLISGIGGCMGIVRFFSSGDDPAEFTAWQLTRRLIVPHVLILVGVGVAVYGVILVVKAKWGSVRSPSDDSL